MLSIRAGTRLIVTADHGQCPLPDAVGGVRLDPIQLWEDLEREFGGGLFDLVQNVVPSEVYLHADVLWDTGATREDVAAFLRDYPYRRNIGPYVPRNVIEQELLDRQQFAAVFATSFLDTLAGRDLDADSRSRHLSGGGSLRHPCAPRLMEPDLEPGDRAHAGRAPRRGRGARDAARREDGRGGASAAPARRDGSAHRFVPGPRAGRPGLRRTPPGRRGDRVGPRDLERELARSASSRARSPR